MEKKIIILAKSYKHSGYCVAGIDYETGEWIRLISKDEETEHAVPLKDLEYTDGGYVEVYDVVLCSIVKKSGTKVQPENCLYDENVRWKKVDRSSLDEVISRHGLDTPSFIFENTDKVLPAEWIFDGKPSLFLVKVHYANIVVKTFNANKKISLCFKYNGEWYNYISISQKSILEEYKNMDDGRYTIKDVVYAVFSLTDRYCRDGKYYKVVSQILEY